MLSMGVLLAEVAEHAVGDFELADVATDEGADAVPELVVGCLGRESQGFSGEIERQLQQHLVAAIRCLMAVFPLGDHYTQTGLARGAHACTRGGLPQLVIESR
jgi:hypothetical protein